VGAVLTGQIRVRGDEISIRAELVDIANDRQLWGDKYARQLADIFFLEQQIATEISDALKLQLTSADRDRLGKAGTEDPEAHRLYLKGRYLWNKRSEEGLESSIGYFQKAIERDPTYALAHSGVADSYAVLAGFGFLSPKEALPKAKAAALRAVEIDSTLAEAHACLAWILGSYDWDFSGAEREFKKAIESDPSYATAYHWYSFQLARMGRMGEAIAASERAVELDPLSPMIAANLAYRYFVNREYETAERQCSKVVKMDADFSWAHTVLGLISTQQAMYEKAIDQLALGARLSGDSHEALMYLGYGLAVAGKTDDARKILDEFAQRARRRYVAPCCFALIHVGLGDRKEAFEWLDKAYEARDTYLCYQLFEPSYDTIRNDPRFDALLRRIGLDPSVLKPALEQ
jgi:tetratricopeptide (TPR) repeat protein